VVDVSELVAMRPWPFGKKRDHDLVEYTEPTFRGALTMLVLIIVTICALWIAYSWALNQPGLPNVDQPGQGQPAGQVAPN
jgi:hypothetical protein